MFQVTNHPHLFRCFPQAVYSKSEKVRKVAISKAIVEAIYSMEPPGRFLRKCAATGEWQELSKKEALNKAAQAMAYAVRDLAKVERGQSRAVPSQITISRCTEEGSQHGRTHQEADNSTDPSLQSQRLLQPLQLPTNQNPVASLNGLAQLLHLDQQLQQTHQQRQQLLLSLMGPRQFQPETQHAFASVPSNLSQILNPSSSVRSQGALLNDILRHVSSSSLQGSPSLQNATLPGMQSIPNRQDLLSLIRGIPQNQAETTLPRPPSDGTQLQHRLDALLQNQLLSSLGQNQWLLQQPSRPLDLLQQALPSLLQSNISQNLTNVHPLLARMMASSSPYSSAPRQQGREEEKKDGSEDRCHGTSW
mmetsp:Transcript_1275/g.2119  ORF Transcript_1275/g.2119 Transcript_1275/m.2119 type:complete len:362 (-) Transcript_1275:211-1296(-)